MAGLARRGSMPSDTHTPEDGARYRRDGWWRDRTLLDDFLATVAARPDKVAIVAHREGRTLPEVVSYGQLGAYVDRCARAMIELGVQPGDVVSIQLPNGWQFPVVALATMRAGAIPNPIPPIYREFEVGKMVRHAESKLLVVPASFRGFSHEALAVRLQAEVPTLAHAVVVGATDPAAVDFESIMLDPARDPDAAAKAALDALRPGADDPAVLLFTSGTTGTPKAAVHTHNSLWSAGFALPDSIGLTPEDVCFMASTMGHLTGFYWGMALPLAQGQKVVYQDVWNARQLIELIGLEQISWTLSATPFALDLVEMRKQSPRDISSFRSFVCGGAPIPPHVAAEVKAQLGCDLISLWGCTEVGICTIHRPGASVETLAASDGMPVRQMELRIVDEDGAPVADGEDGALHVRGPGIFAGYLKQPELTADLRTDDNWYDTGDRGRRTPDGGIRISGRTKDIIIRGGQNIPVVEIENELILMPEVREVAVIGVPDDRLGERGCAVIAPEGAAPTLADLCKRLEASGMAKQFWPERIEIVDALPRTPAGKIQKFVLRERFAKA
ncbi:AMP-binding protein [Sphingoaurantiacus capsulatus]|uniref:AMP-binding protein n=1 Tax=Sphingoaurantiacus capsulatus TaxID=1771310 RepID=A0ABV7XAJ9_9SPHN